MVVTRNQARMAGVRPSRGLDRIRRSRRWIKRYRPTDWAKRHRLRDEQPKTQQVSAYSRRT